ncbi:MAG: hypothetical protein WCB12_16585 [Bryobacteraceae bacterium]
MPEDEARYQTTGLQVTADEAGAWLAELKAAKHAGIPKCHP